MGLENIRTIDAVGFEQSTNTIVLSIIDSWDWLNEKQHLISLQEKLNAYFEFVESGQIYEAYPNANGKLLRLDIIARYEIPIACSIFLQKAQKLASDLNLSISHKLHNKSE